MVKNEVIKKINIKQLDRKNLNELIELLNLKDIIKNNSIFITGVGASLIILGVCAEIDNRKSKGVC